VQTKEFYMRRFQIALIGLMLGSAATVSAQQPQNPRGDRERQEQRGGRPDFFADALRGINLSTAQQQQLARLREQYQPMGGPRGRGMRRGERGDSARVRRPEGARPERRDTAEFRQNREEARARMEARREQMITDLRAILTPAQREQFNQNLQELQQRFQQGERRPRGNGSQLRSR
jgi:Spy/CpxP family protein refolding chaperone